MAKKLVLSLLSLASLVYSYAQEAEKNLIISGSVDGYYRFSFLNAKTPAATNNTTSFTNSHNSFELGMASLKAAYTKGKISAVLDLGFGTRANEFSYNETGALQTIKQAYVSYAPSDKVKFSMGKWATHLGYELLDPQLNRNYSMSYMFSYGPFSHTGLKVDFTLGGGFGIMAGVANPTDFLTASFAKKNFIAQISKVGDKASAYLNLVAGDGFAQFGLTAVAKVSDKFSLGYDGTVKSVNPPSGSSQSWWGSALYLNFDPSDKFGITIRGEYFDDKKGLITDIAGAPLFATSIFQPTLSFNIKPAPGISIIPEFRLDSAKDKIFIKDDASTTKSSGSFILAAVVSF